MGKGSSVEWLTAQMAAANSWNWDQHCDRERVCHKQHRPLDRCSESVWPNWHLENNKTCSHVYMEYFLTDHIWGCKIISKFESTQDMERITSGVRISLGCRNKILTTRYPEFRKQEVQDQGVSMDGFSVLHSHNSVWKFCFFYFPDEQWCWISLHVLVGEISVHLLLFSHQVIFMIQ